MAYEYDVNPYFYDDRGNARVDFVWGNMPPKPNRVGGWQASGGNRWGLDTPWWNYNWGEFWYPHITGYEYLEGGHAKLSEWNEFFNGEGDYSSPNYDGKTSSYFGFDQDGLRPGDYLNPFLGDHVNYFVDYNSESPDDINRGWNAFPQHEPNTGWQYGQNSLASYGTQGIDYRTYLDQLKNWGVPEQLLKPMTFSGGSGPYDYEGGTPNYDGVVIWRYMDPETVLPGKHWDGSDWLAKEVNGQTQYTTYYLPKFQIGTLTGPDPITGDPVPVASVSEWFEKTLAYVETHPEDRASYLGWNMLSWFGVVVVQTEDPTKDTYSWWD